LPRSAWIATYALPISEAFPVPSRGPAVIATWQYGLIAESAFTGPYADAQPHIDSLKAYVMRSGFAIVGGLEEEFERGRGTLYQGHPETYRTLLRYRIHEVRGGGEEDAPLTSN
jgi:effector-binding domain-containing protein